MIALTLGEIATCLDGTLVLPESHTSASFSAATEVSGAVHTDSRLVTTGAIFFALPGEVTDGHLFAQSAVERGAALVVAERQLDLAVPQIVVHQGLAALAALASEVVGRVRAAGKLSVVAITGSNGKTTTKNMLRAILGSHGATVAPEGSFNNEVGAPISMLGVDFDTRYLVVELGASGIGEIAALVAIATPDVAIVLKVGLAHVGGFGGIEEVRQAKSELVTGLPPSSVAVLNADDHRVAGMAEVTRASVRTFGLSDAAEVKAIGVRATAAGTEFNVVLDGIQHPVRLRILGEHHVSNALAAITASESLGVPVQSAIEAVESLQRAERWRMEVLERPDGVTIINDAYNASPDSTAAALKTLAQITGPGQRSVAVLGHMAELGEYADEEHDRIGRLIVRLNVHKLVVVGHEARHIHNAAGLEGSWDGESVLVESAAEAYDLLRDELRKGDVVLVKSSNSAGLRHLGDKLAEAGA